MPTIPAGHAVGNADTNAKLTSVDGNATVSFKYNPAAISITHTAPMTPSSARTPKSSDTSASNSSGVMASTPDGRAAANGFTIIGVRSLTFDGPSVAADCLVLLGWTQFVDTSQQSATTTDGLQQLKFIWGDVQVYLVTLNQVTINYTKFSQSGKPVRALVDLSMYSVPKLPGPTNPSSGGLAGRRTHLLTGAETLPELSTRYYGGPGRWREIAAANGVEDPLRVQPGTRVYVPSAQEAGR
jgi:nucleoid-associated protein YgaU